MIQLINALSFIIIVIRGRMNQTLLSKMRALSIQSIKSRREEMFQKTRNIMQTHPQNQYEQTEQSCIESSDKNQMESSEGMSEEIPVQSKRNSKKKGRVNKFKTYWKNLLQISDWMVEIPQNLQQYYIASRPDGNKCLIIFNDYKVQIRNKSGKVIEEMECCSKMFDGTILEGYHNQQLNKVIISDLIIWKSYPLTSNQFQFRLAWIVSNLNKTVIKLNSKIQIKLVVYRPCNRQSIRETYEQVLSYPKEGLIFIHKDSPYVHGLNPLSLIWKDLLISKYLINEMEENRQMSKGLAYLNKNGQVRSLQNILLFKVNRLDYNPGHRFLRFHYKSIAIETIEQDNITIRFDWINVVQTVQFYNNSVDSIAKLLYKSRISHQQLSIQSIYNSLPPISTSN